MKFGIVVFPVMNITEIVEWSKVAEKNNFDCIWMPDESPSPGYKDIFVLLTVIAMNTKNISLGTSIFNPYTRHPAIIVNGLLSVAEVAKDRKIIFGVGAGGILTLGPLGINMWDHPVMAVRDTVLIARRLLSGELVDFENKFFKVVNLRLPPPKTKIPIYIAARGKQMLKLVGKYGDGALLTTPVNYLETSVDIIRSSAEEHGRQLKDIDIANWMPLGIDTHESAARESVKPTVALLISFLPSYMIESANVDEEKVEQIKTLMQKNKSKEATELVDDEMIDQFGIAGTPSEIIEKLKFMEKKGLTNMMIGDPFGPDPKKSIALFGKEVIPAFKE